MVGDVDLGALNANHALLRACWEALLPLETLRDMPAVITGLVAVDKATVDWSVYPPGIATLGLGPVAVSGLQHGKLKLGKCIGVDFTGEGPPPAHGYYSRGYVKCVEGEGLEGTPEAGRHSRQSKHRSSQSKHRPSQSKHRPSQLKHRPSQTKHRPSQSTTAPANQKQQNTVPANQSTAPANQSTRAPSQPIETPPQPIKAPYFPPIIESRNVAR